MALRQSNLGQLFIGYALGKSVHILSLNTGTTVYDMMQLHTLLHRCLKTRYKTRAGLGRSMTEFSH